jgi:hypothetical protein
MGPLHVASETPHLSLTMVFADVVQDADQIVLRMGRLPWCWFSARMLRSGGCAAHPGISYGFVPKWSPYSHAC